MRGVAVCAVESLKDAAFEPLDVTANEGHTRAVMKIQEGCDNRCAYCIIPDVRGPIRSRALEDVRREALETFKKQQKASEITEDDLKALEKDMQELTDKHCKLADGESAKKEQELLAI